MTNIPDWNRLRFFYVVSIEKSFSAAEAKLNLSASAISRQISALEKEIKSQLFHRHPRGLVLTEQGELLFETTKDIYKRIHEAEACLIAGQNTPSGHIKITTTRSFGTQWLSPRLVKFCKNYPEINIELLLDDKTFNLPMREADFAIRMWKASGPDIISEKFITMNYHLYASKNYIKQYGKPESIQDLDNHKMIAYTNHNPILRDSLNLHLYIGKSHKQERQSVYASTSLTTILHAVNGGLGVALLPDYMTYNNDNLYRIVPELDANSFETYLVYPSEISNTKRIQLLRDFLFASAKEWEY
jgi:DNA-binding transcriptional LysR family regulator